MFTAAACPTARDKSTWAAAWPTAPANYVLEVSAIPYAYLTATATTPLGSTSEFSPVFVSTAFQMYLPLVLR